ncbi:hypothetical protein SUGI_0848420 [Cryptomeria japonica]|nr:hypothetical protein SUGI_0848420 [Cryptomeria japonica]
MMRRRRCIQQIRAGNAKVHSTNFLVARDLGFVVCCRCHRHTCKPVRGLPAGDVACSEWSDKIRVYFLRTRKCPTKGRRVRQSGPPHQRVRLGIFNAEDFAGGYVTSQIYPQIEPPPEFLSINTSAYPTDDSLFFSPTQQRTAANMTRQHGMRKNEFGAFKVTWCGTGEYINVMLCSLLKRDFTIKYGVWLW